MDSHSKKNYARRTVQGVAVILFANMAAAFFAYLFRMLLARNLSLAEFGFFFALLALGGLLAIFRDLGLSQATYYFVPRFLAQKRFGKLKGFVLSIMTMEFIMGCAFVLLILLFSSVLINSYFHAGTFLILLLFAFCFFLNSLEMMFQHLFNAFHNRFLFSLQTVARSVLIFALTFAAFHFISGIAAPLTMQLITYALLLIAASIAFFWRMFPSFFKTVAQKTHVPALISFGMVATASLVGLLLLSYTDTLLLTYFRTLEEVGLYNAAVPIITLMLYIPLSIGAGFASLTSELWIRREKKLLRSIIHIASKYTLIFLIPLAGVLILYPELVLRLLFGDTFTQAYSALAILAFGAIFYGLGQIYLQSLMSIEGPMSNLRILLGVAAFNLVANILLIPRFGIVGAAIATCTSYVLIFLISSWTLYRKLSFRDSLWPYAAILLCGALFVWSVSYLKSAVHFPLFVSLALILAASGALYIALLFLFRVISIREFLELKEKLFSK